MKTVNFIRASALNHRQCVALLEEVHNEYDEIICHTNVRWLCQRVYFETMFRLVE